jgi:hypothetical protein
LKHIERTTLLVSAVTLFSVSVAGAAEPSQPQPSVNSAAVVTQAPSAPVGTTAQPVVDNAVADGHMVDGKATNPAPSAVAPPPVATAVAPNSVGASPYGNGGSDASPPAAPPPAPRPKDDAPATLFASGQDYAIGGFGGLGVMYTRFAGHDRPLVCGEGAVIIDHRFTLGGGGCGIAAMMNGSMYGNGPHSSDDRMSFGYGGAIVRYHFFSRKAANLAVGGLIGAGGLEIGTYKGTGDTTDWNNYNGKHPDVVFVVEPQIGGYANLTRWLRVGAVGGFRFVSGVDTKGLKASDLMGPTIGGQIQAGWF